ncbi:DUF6232 family protein [Chryseosolibacter indicus]|uniref:Uncharacterized protein n=1 Tax=Chryseosolibacter indicus TaxID=2782351 RepID=A0ABS5VM47_9BACT|nr:DUF6232 family protein [Chryseosolibacter indicus]MBT1701924.1 hypothetical protein [Chryseosolibacter indicus]
MIPDKVIYTDGRDVTVTDSALKVKNTAYNISGITKMCLWTIKPQRWPAVLLLLLGIAGLVCGWMGLLPESMNMNTNSGVINSNTLALWIGAALTVIGIIALVVAKERYAVRIATAEGEKNAVVSYKREYIAQIVDALNKAFSFNTTQNTFASSQPSGYTTSTSTSGKSYVTIKE